MFEQILKNVSEKTPLVHSITNYVTVNDCANVLLASGASPIMADDIEEVEEITSICSSLVINIGTLNQRTIASMIQAGKKANALSHPVVLDPVGAGASSLRTNAVIKLLEEIQFSVIRGNISEIKAICGNGGTTKGVDADACDAISENTLESVIKLAKSLSEKTGAVVAITGAIDIVTDQQKTYIIRNGNPLMSKITGTGCMLSCLIGGYVGANPKELLDSTAASVCAMGLCGELAFQKMLEHDGGTAAYRTYIIDFLSKMSPKLLNGGMKVECK